MAKRTPKRPIPSDQYDLLRKNLKANSLGDMSKSQRPPDNRANINRGTTTTQKEDKTRDLKIGLEDHDEAIYYYFNNVIKPSVVTNGERIQVPIVYGSPERWKSVQKDGYYRDKNGKLQTPLIMYKRDSVAKRRDLGNKLDANNPQLYVTFQEQYTRRNQYDSFTAITNRIPQKEFHAVVVPDYVHIKYSCIIWTDFVAQMNGLIEAINYASDSYWGDPERFKFMAKIDTFSNKTELAKGTQRSVKTDFGLDMQGYIIPDVLNKHLKQQPPRYFSKSVISIKETTE